MSLGPQWCLGVLFGCFYLGKRLALGRGHLERTWAALRRGSAATGSGGGKASGDATHGSHGRFVHGSSVLQDANEHFGRALRGFLEALFSHLWWQHHILIARDHTFRLRLLLPRKNA